MTVFSQILTLIRKDLLLELRNKDVLSAMLVFALIVLAVFNFVFDPGMMDINAVAPGILWVAVLFAGNLGIGRANAREYENAGMQGLLLCPMDRSAIYVAKTLANFLYMVIIELLVLPLMIVFYDLPVGPYLLPVGLVLLLGAFGFAAVGTLFAAISVNTHSREVMLPILLFPVSVPIILAAVKSTAVLLQGGALGDAAGWLQLLIVFDVVFAVVCFLLYEYVLEE